MPYLYRGVLLTFFILVVGGVTRAQCDEAKTTLQINECFAKELKKANSELNRVYQTTVKKLPPDDVALLRKTQRAWLVYRDSQCEAERALVGEGTNAPATWMSCKLELTRKRATEIQTTYQSH